ncbi:MAG: ACP S-malonyltransferase [bacterium]|nr:ACP S-malonyltransferase [bacterium]
MENKLHSVPMIFPGQASQAVGMARDLAAQEGPAGEFLRGVDGVLGYGLTHIMFEGPLETLTETHHAQPAILAHSLAVVLALRERGIVPSLVAGHSIGEYSAAAAAGALSPADALRAVRRRGELMFAAGTETPGAMAAVMGLGADKVAEVCREVGAQHGVVVLANHNSDAQVVISGEVAAVAAAGPALTAAGAKRVIALNVSGAFHSPLLEGAAAGFRAFLATLSIGDPQVPLVANVSARPVTTAAALGDGFGRQLVSAVRWHETMEFIAGGAGSGTPPPFVLEVGPGKVLTGLARRAYPQTQFIPVGTVDEIEALPALLAGGH